jgi:hypothetical protein
MKECHFHDRDQLEQFTIPLTIIQVKSLSLSLHSNDSNWLSSRLA